MAQQTWNKEVGQKYFEQSWNHAVHYLKEPTPQIRAAISELAAGMGQDDPGLLMKVRESSDQMTEGLRDMQSLMAQMQQIQQQQGQMLSELNQQVKVMQGSVKSAVKKLEDSEEDLRNLEEDLRNKPKGFFGLVADGSHGQHSAGGAFHS